MKTLFGFFGFAAALILGGASYAATVAGVNLPPEIPYYQLTKVYIWGTEDADAAACRVGTLSLLSEELDEKLDPEILIGRVMMMRKRKALGLAENVRYSPGDLVIFTPDPERTCAAPPPPVCDCNLTFFPMEVDPTALLEGSSEESETENFVSRNPYVETASSGGSVGGGSGSGGSGGGGSGSGSGGGSTGGTGGGSSDSSSGDEGSGTGEDSGSVSGPIMPDLTNGEFEGDENNVLMLDFARVTTDPGAEVFLFDPEDPDFLGLIPETGAVCGFDRRPFTCTENLYFEFFEEVSDLMFETFFFGPQDRVTAQIFSGDVLLHEIEIDEEAMISFAGFSGITHLFLLDDSRNVEGGRGAAYGNFKFVTAEIPLPASAWQLIVAVLFIGLNGFFVSRRRQEARF